MNQPRFRPRVVRPRVARDPIMDGEGDPSTFITPAPAMSGGYEIAPGYSESPIMSPVYVPPPLPPVVPAAPAPTVAAAPRVVRVAPPREGHGGPNMSPDEIAQAEAAYRSTPEYAAQQSAARAARRPTSDYSTEDLRGMGMGDVELVQLGRMQGPSDATADELRAQGYGEQYVASHASDIRTPAQVRTAEGEIRRLSALTPALPELPVAHQRPAPIVRRGAMDVPAMPSSAPSLDEGYAVRDGALIPRAHPVQVPEGYAVTSDGRMLPRAEPVPMSFMPTEQGGAGYDAGSSQYAPGLVAGSPQFEHDIEVGSPQFEHTITAGSPQFEHDITAGPVQMETTGTVEMGAPQNIRSLAPRVGVPRRRTAPYVAGLPNAPGGTAEMPSALAPNGVDALMNGSGVRTPQRSPLDTQRDTLALNVRYMQQRAQDAQAAGEGIADVEIARQRRLEQNEMDRQRAEGRARQNVQRAADRAAAIRIDPSRAMQGASGIANVIAVVLGGIGSGITGGPNQPLQMVQQNIERDLAAQRTDLDTARNAVADQQSILGNIRQEGMSREAADNVFRANALAQAAAQVEIQAQRTNGAEAGDRANNLREQLLHQSQQALRQAEMENMEDLLAFEQSRSVTGLNDARARATLATAGSTEAENARRARMALMRRPARGSVEAWDRMTPAQQAQALENHQSFLLTGADAATASRLSGVPIAAGERAPVENGARMAVIPGTGGMTSVEHSRAQTISNAYMESGLDPATSNTLAGLAPDSMRHRALPPELSARVNIADAHLRVLEDAFAPGGDVEGYGIIDGQLPDFASRRGDALRRATDTLYDAYRRMMSGAGGDIMERSEYRQLIEGDGTEEGMRIGLQTMRRSIEAVVGNTVGATSNVADQDAMAAQLGVAPRVEAPTPESAPGTPVRQRVPLLRARTSGPGRNLE